MKVKHLTLKAHKCFETLDLDLDSNIVILTGLNGSGKTTILESIADGLMEADLSTTSSTPFSGCTLTYEREDMSSVPVFAYYGVHRREAVPEHWNETPDSALGTQEHFSFLSWLQERAHKGEFQSRMVQKHVNKIQGLLREVWENFDCFEVGPEGEILFATKYGVSLPFESQSSSAKSLCMIFADLAWRCVHFNPLDEVEDVYGVVLIDLIEISLHIQVQRKVIDFLKSSFPRMQFILTTHSPCSISRQEWVYALREEGPVRVDIHRPTH